MDDFVVADDEALSQVLKSLAHKRILVGVQFDVVRDGFIDEIAARAIVRHGERIERFNLGGVGTEADGLFCGTHNTRNILGIAL